MALFHDGHELLCFMTGMACCFMAPFHDGHEWLCFMTGSFDNN